MRISEQRAPGGFLRVPLGAPLSLDDDAQTTSCPDGFAAVGLVAAVELAAAGRLAASRTPRRSRCCGPPDPQDADRPATAFRIQPSRTDLFQLWRAPQNSPPSRGTDA